MMLLATAAAAATLMTAPAQERAPMNGPERVAPRGSFAQSCSGSYVNQGRLYADCRDRRGQMRGTSIELNRCTPHDIANDDGLLICGPNRGSYEDRGGGNGGGGWGGGNNGGGWGGGNNGGGWGGGNNGGWGGGGGRDTIVVYRDSDYRGSSTVFRGEVPDLGRTGFNDMISSMELRGRWEVCSDARFRGNCQIFDSDVRDLSRYGLNDRVSSMRPVRGGGRW